MAKRAMGKGLSAILGDEVAKVNKVTDRGADKLVGSVAMIRLSSITTNPFNHALTSIMMPLLNSLRASANWALFSPLLFAKMACSLNLLAVNAGSELHKLLG